MQTLNMGSEAGGLIMFYHIKIVRFPFKSNASLSKAQQESDQVFHGGNWLRSRLVTLLLNPIPWHSQDQVIVKSTWLCVKSLSDLVDRLLAKRDLRQSGWFVPLLVFLCVVSWGSWQFDALWLIYPKGRALGSALNSMSHLKSDWLHL